MGLLARFFNGSLLWSELWLMTWNEVLEYYGIYELQTVEEEVVNELSYNKKGEKQKLPPYSEIREEVDERIAERRNEVDGKDK